MTKLKSDDDYFFFIKAKRFNFIRLTLTINNYSNQTTNPFSYIYSQEKGEKTPNRYNYKNPLISPIINGNQLIITISQYISGSETTKYINFIIRPSYNIDYMLTNVDITDCFIDLDNYQYSKGIYNLKRNLRYYIKMNAWSNYKTNLNLKIYNISNTPFSFIKIYECLRPEFNQCEKSITEIISFEKKNNIYETTIEKDNTLNKHLYLYIEIISEYDIKYMIAETALW
jgi:hypothetical protein